MASVVASVMVTDSLNEIGVLQAGETLGADDGAFCVGRLNQIFDNWNAQRESVFVERFLVFAFTPSQQDYTIGPVGADFTVANTRPVAIDGANVILDNVSPSVRNPIDLHDYQWWLTLPQREVSTTFPTDCYYAPDWPNGILHFWPTPSTAYGLELVTRNTLAQIVITDMINLPPGYQNAAMLTLAEDVADVYGRDWTPKQAMKAQQARARVYANNTIVPSLVTQDAGMPSGRRNRASFNYRTGLDMNVNR